MRRLALIVIVAACSSPSKPAAPVAPPAPPPPAELAPIPAVAAPAAPAVEHLTADTPKTTVLGNTFIAPAGWTLEVRGPATIVAPPEPDSHIVLVDLDAPDGNAALAKAWAAYRPDARWKVLVASDAPDKDGWSSIKQYGYETSPNERRSVSASVRTANGHWTVVIFDMLDAVGEKRGAQVALMLNKLLPKGYVRETFAGKQAAKLDAAKLAELTKFVETAQAQLGVPGVGLGIVQDGKIVYAGGLGTRELGKPAKVDADTLFIVASNTKALTTLMLAKLVDEQRLTWETAVTSLLPTFQLGNAETTKQVLVKHLICACTGLPRQDLEWLLQFKGVTPAGAMATLATVQPTTKFGEMFQYSNLLAGAAGFVGGHVAYPQLELGAAYDKAMQTRVFDPLGMKATTFDYARALRGNHAMPHAPGFDDKPARALMEVNYSVIPLRPAGGAWSSVRDMLRYIQMELDDGKLPGGKPYIATDTLLARRAPQVPIGSTATYGMGLIVDTKYGVPVVHHGGDLLGYHSDMMWLPDSKVGAVVLTNGDPGWMIRDLFRRKLLEVLFDGHPEADAELAANAKTFFEQRAASRKLLKLPADPELAGKLAAHYKNDALGDIAVTHPGKTTVFDFGEFKTEVASKANPDGSVSFATVSPGFDDFELVVGPVANGKRTLIVRDAQHEYLFTEP